MFRDVADIWHTFHFDSSLSILPGTSYKNYIFYQVQQYAIMAYNIQIIDIQI